MAIQSGRSCRADDVAEPFVAIISQQMTRIIFHKPALVQRGRIDRDRIILSARDAADFLLRDWPGGAEAKRERAMLACLDVLRGNKPPSHARRAFIVAARQARILLDDWSGRNWQARLGARLGQPLLPDPPVQKAPPAQADGAPEAR